MPSESSASQQSTNKDFALHPPISAYSVAISRRPPPYLPPASAPHPIFHIATASFRLLPAGAVLHHLSSLQSWAHRPAQARRGVNLPSLKLPVYPKSSLPRLTSHPPGCTSRLSTSPAPRTPTPSPRAPTSLTSRSTTGWRWRARAAARAPAAPATSSSTTSTSTTACLSPATTKTTCSTWPSA